MNRYVRYLANLLLLVLAVGAILGMVNYLAARHHTRWDWTSDDYYTLSDKSRAVVRDLTAPVTIIVFLQPGLEWYEDVRQLLEQYRGGSTQVTVEYVDPNRNQVRAIELVQKYKTNSANVIILDCQGRTKFLADEELVERDYEGATYGQAPDVKAFRGEEKITSALLEITQTVRPVVGFTTGHGEPDLSALRELLVRDNYDVVELNLLALDRVPDTCAVLLAIGPQAAFRVSELAAVDTFLSGGGKALFALDPLVQADNSIQRVGLEQLLSARGVTVHDDVVFDPQLEPQQIGPGSILSNRFGFHDLVKPLAALQTLFLVARSFAADTLPEGVSYAALVSTTDAGWGERELDQQPIRKTDRDIAGPLDLAFIIEKKDGYGIVGIGDSDFLTKAADVPGNLDLFVNAVNYLAARKSLVAIPARNPKTVKLTLTPEQLNNLFWLTVVLIPLASLISGIYVWFRRRV